MSNQLIVCVSVCVALAAEEGEALFQVKGEGSGRLVWVMGK